MDKLVSIIPPIFTPVVKEFSDVPKEFQDKLSPICDTQSEIESDFKKFTYHPDIDSDEDVDDDFTDDQVHEELGDVVESSTLISPEVIPVITEFIDVFLKMLHTIALVKHFRVTCPLLAPPCHKKDTITVESLRTMKAAPM